MSKTLIPLLMAVMLFADLETGHSGYYSFSNVFCSSGIPNALTKDISNHTLSFSSDDSSTCNVLITIADSLRYQSKQYQQAYDDTIAYCNKLKSEGHSLIQGSDYQEANDTLRKYIEHCAVQQGSFHEFEELNSSVQFMSNDNNRWLDYREWLKKVLYLNIDTLYYCSDMNSILTTFNYLRPGRGIDYNGEIAILDYILQNNRCPENNSFFVELRNNARIGQTQIWRDSVKDSTKTPLDTSEVTLESLDLQILRGPQFSVITPSGVLPSLADIFVTENPFTLETSLETTLREAQMLKLEIFDVLGKKLYDENKFFSEGCVKWTLAGRDLPHGTVYARISTIDGKVRTAKIIHEK